MPSVYEAVSSVPCPVIGLAESTGNVNTILLVLSPLPCRTRSREMILPTAHSPASISRRLLRPTISFSRIIVSAKRQRNKKIAMSKIRSDRRPASRNSARNAKSRNTRKMITALARLSRTTVRGLERPAIIPIQLPANLND